MASSGQSEDAELAATLTAALLPDQNNSSIGDARVAIININEDSDHKASIAAAMQQQQPQCTDVAYTEIAQQFSILGWTACGGPSAHIGMFQRRLVDKMHWMSSDVYAELFALCQCIPGPTSTQVSFAIGVLKKDMAGGLLSGALFQYPGALIMTAAGVFAAHNLISPAGALAGMASGVAAVGVALVASAAKGMAGKLCTSPLTTCICTAAAVVAYYWPKAYTFPAVITAGGLTSLVHSYITKQAPAPAMAEDPSVKSHGLTTRGGGVLLAVWALLLVATLAAGSMLPDAPLPFKWWEVFYRAGSIVYGGGQVVLPMLFTDLVQQSCGAAGCIDTASTWITSQQFYAGLGIAQALPGPLFNFSAYLGAVMAIRAGVPFYVGSAVAWLGLFVPGVVLVFAVLPFWAVFRSWSLYRRALPGLNAAGVGLIVASVFSLAFGALGVSAFKATSLCIGMLAFAAVDQLKVFEPAVVVGGGLMGILAGALGML